MRQLGWRQDGAVTATLAGVVDRLRGGAVDVTPWLDPADRLDGRSVLVTGGNRGLGRAVAQELARRGGRVLLACRSGLPEAADALARESGGTVVGAPLDLADLDSVVAFVQGLRERRERIDVAVLNAGIVPAASRLTRDGFEEMFQVNYLANVLLVRGLLDEGVLRRRPPEDLAAGPAPAAARRPRLVFVSSESHRSAAPVPPGELGRVRAYDMRGSVAAYGASKLLLEALVAELAGRYAGPAGQGPEVAVHSICPGAVNSGIAREAPVWAKPLLGLVMQAFFRPPEEAALPVVALAAAGVLEGETGRYHHVTVPKDRADAARDPDYTAALWDEAHRLLGPWLDRIGH